MKTETRKVYQCEFCRKRMLSAASMARHERYCKARPENQHKCFQMCSHLKRKKVLIDGKYPDSRYSYKTEFTCDKVPYQLYSYLLEKKASLWENRKISFEGMFKMPTTCIHYEYMSDSELGKRFPGIEI